MKFLEAKLITLGQWGVGKTCIVKRYTDKSFEPCYRPTLGACFLLCKIDVDDVKVTLQIWDTAGEERFKSIMPMYHRAANAVLLAFDLTKYDSFIHIKSVFLEFRKYSDENIVLALVGNKIDLIDKREVSEDEAKTYASSIGASYYEVSALQGDGIDEIFHTTASGLVKLANEGRNTNIKMYNCSKPVDRSCNNVLKSLNEQNGNRTMRIRKCSCK